MANINTGYQPQFGLGAYFAGENAANQEAMSQEELLRAFIENQKAQQSYKQAERINPLEVIKKQQENQVGAYDAAYATKKLNDPNYMDANIQGQIGQMQTQAAAGKTAAALQPFKQKAEQSTLENQQATNETLWTINDIDKQLAAGGGTDENGNVVKFTPMQQMFMKNKRDQLTEQLKNTPEFAGKKELSDDKIEAQLEAQRLRMQAMIDAAELKAQASKKDAKYNEILMQQMQIVADPNATPQEKAIANQIIQLHRTNKLYSNPAAWQEGIDLSKLGVQMAPSIIERAQGAETPPVVVNNTDEWNKLPKGTKYTTSDGRKGIK